MKISVCVHRAIDPETRLKLTDAGTVETEQSDWRLDLVDASALEAAVRIASEQQGEVTAIAVGGEAEDEVLRTSIAHGANRAVRIDGILPSHGAEAGAALAAAIANGVPPDLIICGAASSDFGGGTTAAVLAARLGLPIVQNVIRIDEVKDTAVVQRRCDGGYREKVRVRLPAVLAVERTVAVPRYATTRARLQALAAPIQVMKAAGAATAANAPSLLGYRTPAPQRLGVLWPEADMSARERLRFLQSGGGARRAERGKAVTGTAAEAAAAIEAFLRERGFVAENGH
jgi:electron transfer flavoprotein beta subunit